MTQYNSVKIQTVYSYQTDSKEQRSISNTEVIMNFFLYSFTDDTNFPNKLLLINKNIS